MRERAPGPAASRYATSAPKASTSRNWSESASGTWSLSQVAPPSVVRSTAASCPLTQATSSLTALTAWRTAETPEDCSSRIVVPGAVPPGRGAPAQARSAAPASTNRIRVAGAVATLRRLTLPELHPAPDEQHREDRVDDGERLPHVRQALREPVAEHRAGVRHLQQDAVGDQVAVGRRLQRHLQEHQPEDEQHRRAELHVAPVVRRC